MRERARAREAEDLAKLLQGMKQTGENTTEVEVDGEKLVYINEVEVEGEGEGGRGKGTGGSRGEGAAAGPGKLDEKAWADVFAKLDEMERLEATAGGSAEKAAARPERQADRRPVTAAAPAQPIARAQEAAAAPARPVSASTAATAGAGQRAFTGRVVERDGGGGGGGSGGGAAAAGPPPPPPADSSRPLSRFAQARKGML